MHFKILVVFAFILHIYLHLCQATNMGRLFTIIFYWDDHALFEKLYYIFMYIYTYIYIYYTYIYYIYICYIIYTIYVLEKYFNTY